MATTTKNIFVRFKTNVREFSKTMYMNLKEIRQIRHSEGNKKWYQRNKEEIKKKRMDYYYENSEKINSGLSKKRLQKSIGRFKFCRVCGKKYFWRIENKHDFHNRVTCYNKDCEVNAEKECLKNYSQTEKAKECKKRCILKRYQHYLIQNRLHRHKGLSKWDYYKIFRRDKCCVYCYSSSKLTLDHIIPVTKGGQNKINNYVVACQKCNSSKKDKDVIKWCNKKKIEIPNIIGGGEKWQQQQRIFL